MASPRKSTSPKKHPRKSLQEAFEGLDIGSSSPKPSTSSSSSASPVNLARTLRRTIKKRFPHWGSVRGGVPATFTIRQGSDYDYFYTSEDPDDLFAQANGLFEEVQEMLPTLNAKQDKSLEDFLESSLIELIFGSNFLEKAGSTHDVTIRLCKRVFAGENVEADISERSSGYAVQRDHLVQQDLPSTTKHVVRSRREIIQHAQALKHITTALIVKGQPLTEALIQETHRILCYKVEHEDGDSWDTYAGKYRTVDVTASMNVFCAPGRIGSAMASVIKEFNSDIAKAEQDQELDPYELAAKYCHKFINIHPFVDGNGRTCRLILNAILLKYAGIIVPVGEKEDDRDEYMKIAYAATLEDKMELDDRSQVPWGRLSSFVLTKATGKWNTLREKLMHND